MSDEEIIPSVSVTAKTARESANLAKRGMQKDFIGQDFDNILEIVNKVADQGRQSVNIICVSSQEEISDISPRSDRVMYVSSTLAHCGYDMLDYIRDEMRRRGIYCTVKHYFVARSYTQRTLIYLDWSPSYLQEFYNVIRCVLGTKRDNDSACVVM